jgi:drug/metabolite transporter (DMT)-like permease
MGLGGILLLSIDSLIARGADASAWDVAFWSGSWACVAVIAVLILSPDGGPVTAVQSGGLPLLTSALLQMVSGIAFIYAVKTTAVANVVVITAAAPAAAAVIARIALGERTSRRLWAAIGVALVGIALVVGGSLQSDGVRGEVAALIAVVAFATNVTFLRHHQGLNRSAAVGMAGGFAAVVCAGPAAVVGLDAPTMLLLFLMGAVVGPIARVSLASATRHLTSAEVAMFTPVETVATALGAWLLFDETPRTLTLIGGAVVVTAVAFGLVDAPAGSPLLRSGGGAPKS